MVACCKPGALPGSRQVMLHDHATSTVPMQQAANLDRVRRERVDGARAGWDGWVAGKAAFARVRTASRMPERPWAGVVRTVRPATKLAGRDWRSMVRPRIN